MRLNFNNIGRGLEAIAGAKQARDLAQTSARYDVTEGAYGPGLQENITQLEGLKAQDPAQAAAYDQAIGELTRRQGLTAPDYSIASGPTNFATRQEARQAAAPMRAEGLAGVYRQYGDVERADALETRAYEQQRALAREGREVQDFLTRQKAAERQGLLTEGQITEMNRNQAQTKKLDDVNADVAGWFTKRTTDPETNEPRATTADDMLAHMQYRATALQKAGLDKEATASLKDYQDFAIKRIGLDDAERKSQIKGVAGAIGFGDFKPAVAFYDRFVFDGAKVKDITEDSKTGAILVSRVRDDGTELPDKIIKGGRKELLAALNSFVNPTALYEFSENEFNNNLKLRQVAAVESKAANARELTGLNAKLIDARIDNLNQRTQTLRNPPPPPLTEAQVTARARTMVTNREINPVTRKPYTTNEAVEFVKGGARDPIMDALDAALGGDTDPFAK